jgi:hypothetical protein
MKINPEMDIKIESKTGKLVPLETDLHRQVDHRSRKHEALSANPSTTKKNLSQKKTYSDILKN